MLARVPGVWRLPNSIRLNIVLFVQSWSTPAGYSSCIAAITNRRELLLTSVINDIILWPPFSCCHSFYKYVRPTRSLFNRRQTGIAHTHGHFLLPWLWPWPNHMDRTWPQIRICTVVHTKNELSRSAFKIYSITDTQTGAIENMTTQNSRVVETQ